MKTFRILLPYDGSDAARHALHEIASRRTGLPPDAEVVLLNVQNVYIDAELGNEARTLETLHRLDAEALLRPAEKRLAEAGVPHRTMVAFGRPAQVIVGLAVRERIDLIVMGARLRHPLLEMVSGSVSREVMRDSPIPVMPFAAERIAA